MRTGGRARDLGGFLYVGPFLFFYAAILIYPLLLGIGISFSKADLFGSREWVGFANYSRLFADPMVEAWLEGRAIPTVTR